jgi:hypothetical protein
MPDYQLVPTKHARDGAHFIPKYDAENKLGAWAYKVDVKPTEEGLAGNLNGGSAVPKDNIALAGVPLSLLVLRCS